jgi:hypothetical protein
VNIKVTVFWDVTPYSLLAMYRLSAGTWCPRLQGTNNYFCSEDDTYQKTRHHIEEHIAAVMASQGLLN